MIYLSRPFQLNFHHEGGTIVCCGFYFPSSLYKISDITFKLSELLKHISYLI